MIPKPTVLIDGNLYRVVPQLSMMRVRCVVHFMTALCAVVVFGNLLELCIVLGSYCRPRYRTIIIMEGFALMLSISCAVVARFKHTRLVTTCKLDRIEWLFALIAAGLHGAIAGLVSSVRTGLGNISAVSFSWICLLLSTVVALLAFTTENGPVEKFFFVLRGPGDDHIKVPNHPSTLDNNDDGDDQGTVDDTHDQNIWGEDSDDDSNENEGGAQNGCQQRATPSSATVIDIIDPAAPRPWRNPLNKSIKDKRTVATEPCQRIGRVNATINVQAQEDDRDNDIVEAHGETSQWRPSKRGHGVDFDPTHHQGRGASLGTNRHGRAHARGDQLGQGAQAEGASSKRENKKKKEKRSERNTDDGDEIRADVRAQQTGRGSGLGARLAAIAAEKETDGDDGVRKPKTNTGIPLRLTRTVPREHEIVERL